MIHSSRHHDPSNAKVGLRSGSTSRSGTQRSRDPEAGILENSKHASELQYGSRSVRKSRRVANLAKAQGKSGRIASLRPPSRIAGNSMTATAVGAPVNGAPEADHLRPRPRGPVPSPEPHTRRSGRWCFRVIVALPRTRTGAVVLPDPRIGLRPPSHSAGSGRLSLPRERHEPPVPPAPILTGTFSGSWRRRKQSTPDRACQIPSRSGAATISPRRIHPARPHPR